jgi:hypothetical protein
VKTAENTKRRQVCIASLRKTGLAVRATTWERNLGGRDFDEALFDHFCADFKAKQKIDVKSNAKAAFKLRMQCEKVRPGRGHPAAAARNCGRPRARRRPAPPQTGRTQPLAPAAGVGAPRRRAPRAQRAGEARRPAAHRSPPLPLAPLP